MKFTVSQPILNKLLTEVRAAVPNGKPLQPIMSHIAVLLKGNTLMARATNSEITIAGKTTVQGQRDGGVCLPADLLVPLIQSISSDKRIVLDLNEETLNLAVTAVQEGQAPAKRKGPNVLNNEANIKGVAYSNFPQVGAGALGSGFTCGQGVLKRALRKTSFSVGKEDEQGIPPVYTGLCMWVEGETVELMGMRTKSMSYTKFQAFPGMGLPENAGITVSLAGSAIDRLAQVLSDDNDERVEVAMSANNSQLICRFSDKMVAISTISGTISKHITRMPKADQFNTRVELNVGDVLKVLSTLSLFAKADKRNILEFGLTEVGGEPVLRSFANFDQVGDNTQDLEVVSLVGPSNQTAADIAVLAEVLRSVNTPTVYLDIFGPQGNVMIRPVGDDSHVLSMAPIKLDIYHLKLYQEAA